MTEQNTKPQKQAENNRKVSRFTKVLLIWLVVLTVAIAVGLICFNKFAGRYEERYSWGISFCQQFCD